VRYSRRGFLFSSKEELRTIGNIGIIGTIVTIGTIAENREKLKEKR
jgi:hypothetical protein